MFYLEKKEMRLDSENKGKDGRLSLRKNYIAAFSRDISSIVNWRRKSPLQKAEIQEVIVPIDKELLLGELTPERLLRTTSRGDNEIYLVNQQNAPHVMQEIGRLRELTFRSAGGGTGKSADIDEYDNKFQQLVLRNPDEKEIIGGYRFAPMQDLVGEEDGNTLASPTEEIFKFSPKFSEEYLPHTIELGRSFVQPKYQSKE